MRAPGNFYTDRESGGAHLSKGSIMQLFLGGDRGDRLTGFLLLDEHKYPTDLDKKTRPEFASQGCGVFVRQTVQVRPISANADQTPPPDRA
mgnify:CR=1 FL=1